MNSSLHATTKTTLCVSLALARNDRSIKIAQKCTTLRQQFYIFIAVEDLHLKGSLPGVGSINEIVFVCFSLQFGLLPLKMDILDKLKVLCTM